MNKSNLLIALLAAVPFGMNAQTWNLGVDAGYVRNTMSGCEGRAGFGQTDHGYNLYGQLFGTSTGIGVGFDSRFKTGGVLGYSVGMAFTSISYDNSDGMDGCYSYRNVDSKGISIPFEVNAIMGKRASKFEIGLGATTYLIHRDEMYSKSKGIGDGALTGLVE